MIHFIVGNYELKKNDHVVKDLSSGSLHKSLWTKDKNLVAYSDELQLTKKLIDWLVEQEFNLTVVVPDKKLLKGKRKKTKLYDITELDNSSTETALAPWDLAKYLFTCQDRDMMFQYLKDSKNSLYVLLMVLSCNMEKLIPQNREIVEWLVKNYFRVKYEIVCAKLSYHLKLQQIYRFDWLYPKKKKEDESEDD